MKIKKAQSGSNLISIFSAFLGNFNNLTKLGTSLNKHLKRLGPVHGRQQTFFQRRTKFSWGQKHNMLLKNIKNDTIFLRKVKNILFWPARGKGG